MWNTIQCAVQGRSHVKAGIPCQDKTFSIYNNQVHVISLADGAGSARLSHFGAETITKLICSILPEQFDFYFAEKDGASVKRAFIEAIKKTLCEKASELGCNESELASTLLFVAVKDDKFILAHIGDGVIGYLKKDELLIASQPKNGEFINTTVFTTSNDAVLSMTLIKGSIGQIQGFVLMSDGTEESLYDKRERRLADILMRIMNMTAIIHPEPLQEQLEKSFEGVVGKATSDDCSIAILMKKGIPYKKMSAVMKCRILGLPLSTRKKYIKRYDEILSFLMDGMTLSQLSKHIHLKEKYTKKKYVDKLFNLKFIDKKGKNYHTILIMDDND